MIDTLTAPITWLAYTEFPADAFDASLLDPRAAPGDVCNRDGDIRMPDQAGRRGIVQTGVVYVTPEQAKAAAPYGWKLWGEWPDDAELVQIARSNR